MNTRLESIATSPWSWLLVSLGAVSLIASPHLMNALAAACGRWTSTWLGTATDDATSVRPVHDHQTRDRLLAAEGRYAQFWRTRQQASGWRLVRSGGMS